MFVKTKWLWGIVLSLSKANCLSKTVLYWEPQWLMLYESSFGPEQMSTGSQSLFGLWTCNFTKLKQALHHCANQPFTKW